MMQKIIICFSWQSNPKAGAQSRLRKRGRNGRWSYTCTVRRPECKGQAIEVKTPLSKKDYEYLLNHVDEKRLPVYKTRRCFVYNNQQYQLDIYRLKIENKSIESKNQNNNYLYFFLLMTQVQDLHNLSMVPLPWVDYGNYPKYFVMKQKKNNLIIKTLLM